MKMHAAVLTALLLVVPQVAAADTGPAEATLTVEGQGTVSRAPDVASFGAQIVTNTPDAASAQSQNNTRYAAVLSALAKQGIGKDQVSGDSYSLNYYPPPSPPPGQKRHLLTPVPPSGEMYGYVVTRSVRITVPRLDRVGAAIDAAVGAGLTGVNGVDFSLRDRRTAYAAALAAALDDADAQAKALAASGRFRLGALRTVQTGSAQGPIGPRMFAAAPMASPTTIAPSNVDVAASVTVTYAILPSP
jgi:uncharacterized protein YggE